MKDTKILYMKKLLMVFSFLTLFLFSSFSVYAAQTLSFGKSQPLINLKVEGVSTKPFFTLEKTKEIKFSINPESCKLYKIKKWDYVKVADLKPATAPGEPQLPMKTFVIKLPLNAKVNDVKIVDGSYVEILNKLDIAPTPQPIRWGEENLPKYIQNKKVYSLNSFFPGKALKYEIGRDNKNQYVYVRIYPLQYIPAQKKAILITDATIEVYYTENKNFFLGSSQSYQISGASSSKAVIITPPELYQQALELAKFHNDSLGVNTTVVNTTWIYANYGEAEDPPYKGYKDSSITGWGNIKGYNYSLAKRIINYTRTNTQFDYIILFGNARLVPPSYYMYISHDDAYNNWIPTDFFYASPDYDLTPNYMIGRIPVNNSAEAEHVVQKIKAWVGNLSIDWFKNVALAGGKPFGTELFIGELVPIIAVNKNDFEGMNITKLYYTEGKFTKKDVTNALAGNTGIAYIITHGSGACMATENDNSYVCSTDLLNLDANSKVPVVASVACMDGAFDSNLYPNPYHLPGNPYRLPVTQTMFGESVLLSNASGIAYVGGSRVNWGCAQGYLDKGYLHPEVECYMQAMLTYFFDAYHEGAGSLGNITKSAMEKYYINNDFRDKINNVTFFEFTLLGDPVLELPKPQRATVYQQPNSTPVNFDGFIDASRLYPFMSGEIPIYNLDKNEAAKISIATDSPSTEVKLINLDRDVKEEEKKVTGEEYSFIPPKNAPYLIRASSEDSKEGWLYVYAQLIPSKGEEVLYLSAPRNVRQGNDVWIRGEVAPLPLIMNFTATLTFPNGTVKDLGTTTSDKYGKFWFIIDTHGYPSGEYTVTVNGQLESLSLKGTVKFEIADYDELRIFLLSSKNFNQTKCEEYGFRECKVWPIATTGIINSTTCQPDNCDILKLSKSGEVHNATITLPNGEKRYIAVVDTNWPFVYDMVFIDDDPIFMQSSTQEINLPEKGFLTEGDIVGSINTLEGEKVNIKLAKIARNGNSILLITPPAKDELPYHVNDEVNFIVLALKDGNPKEGIKIYPRYYYITPTELPASTTDKFGLSSIYSFTVHKSGSYLIEVNRYWSKIIEVKPNFDIKYAIKDADTGEEKSVFKPGDKIKFEVSAVDRKTGNLIPLKEAYVDMCSLWICYGVSLKDSNKDYVYEGTYSLSKDAEPGTWYVVIYVETEEGSDIVQTSFKVKTFEVKTFSQEKFAPNETAFILVTAIEPGWSGDVYKIPKFYPIDDPNTTIDECSKDEFGNYRNVVIRNVFDDKGNKLDTSNWNITNVETFLEQGLNANSKFLQKLKKYQGKLSEELLRQCVIQFKTPIKKGTYLGDLSVKRADKEEWEEGSFTFSVQLIEAGAYPWDPNEGWRYAFFPGSNVTLKIEAWDLLNDKEIPPSDIVDAKITEIKGKESSVEILNQSFIKTNEYALLKFIAPNQTGWYNVKFMIKAQINESGTLKNETGLGEGWFSVRLYDVLGWSEKWMYATNESVPIKVKVRDFSGNPVSNIKIEVERIMNWKTREDYTNKIIWQPNITDSNGETLIVLRPKTLWKKGWYDVRLKATDPEGRYEYGWAGFEIKNYRVSVTILVNGEWKWRITKGDTITFIPLVWKVSQDQDKAPLDSSHYSISLNDSALNYYGNEWSYKYEPEKIKLSDLNAKLWKMSIDNISFWAINISTNSNLINSGSYEASIKLKIGNEEEIGREWFRIIAFEPYAKVLQKVYGPGDKASINVSVSPKQPFNITLKELRGCYEEGCYEVDVNSTTLQCDGNCLYNFTLPANIREGLYDGTLEFSVGNEKEYEGISFEVKTLNIVPPKSVTISLSLISNETIIYNPLISAPCSEIGYNLTLPSEILNDSCTLFNSTLTVSEKIGVKRSNYWVLIDTSTHTVYIDTDKNFTNGTIAYNISINDVFTDKEGINWFIEDIGYDWLRLQANNSLSNGIKVNLSLSKSGNFMFGWFNESEFKEWWEEAPIDLNNNGKLENIYLLAADTQKPGNYDKIFVEYNISDLTTKTPISVGSSTNLGEPVYIIDLTKTTWSGLRAYLTIPEPGGYYPWLETRRINTNISFPVLVTYPNGTAIVGANVSIYRIIFSNLETKELSSDISAQTDSNGIAILTYNLTNSGYYTIIPKVQVGNNQAIMERWISPHVEVKAFHVFSSTYSKLAEINSWEVQTPVKLETTSFPREGEEVWLTWNNLDATPPNGVTNYYAGYIYMGENEWWFLVDNSTGRIYIDDDNLFNETDYGWQNISVGEPFWLSWNESGKTYNITFKLLDRPYEDEIVFGFDLGKWKGIEITLQEGSEKSLEMNGKRYSIKLDKVLSGNEATITLISPLENNTYNITEGEYYHFWPLVVYVDSISNITNSTNLTVSVGDLRIVNYTYNGTNNNIVILDDPTYPNTFDLDKWRYQTYDTVTVVSLAGSLFSVGFHLGFYFEDKYNAVIDPYGDYIILLNGSTKIFNPPGTESNYLVKALNENNLGVDLNQDGDLEDKFYFVIYDDPFDGKKGYTAMIVDDDNDLLDSYICNSVCYNMDYYTNETGKEENYAWLLTYNYLWNLDAYAFFNNETNTLTLLRDKWKFNPVENISIVVEANDFNWSPIEGNLSIIKIKTWGKEYNTSKELKVKLINGYGLITISPQNFNLTSWPEDFRVIGKVTSNDGREEMLTIWVSAG